MDKVLAQGLLEREQQHLYRRRRTLQSPQTPNMTVDGQSYLGFCSNDYLGLANHPELIAASKTATEQFGTGSGASHLVCGHSSEHHALEQELAAFTGRERALVFSSGYMANLGTINALVGKGDAVFEDKLNHASLLDGGLMSGARFQRFLHNDLDSLSKKLKASDARRKLSVVDSVFSMDGDLAPLPELAELAAEHGAWLMADDAHGFGCLGSTGAGSAEHFGLTQAQLPILMGTLGKAAGSYGAFIAGSEELIETLIQQARPYIYTTAIPPAVAATSRAAIRVIKDEGWRRDQLNRLIERLRAGAQSLGLELLDSPTAIQPVMIGSAERTMAVAEYLRQQGILVGAIRPPTVATGSARLRITLSASHSEAQLDQLLAALASCPELPLSGSI